MSAAMAAVEGSRECVRAMHKQSMDSSPEDDESGADRVGGGEKTDADGENEEDADGAEKEDPNPPQRSGSNDAESAASRRCVIQRNNNNHKVLQRLNAEI